MRQAHISPGGDTPASLSPNDTLEASFGPEVTASHNAQEAGLETYHAAPQSISSQPAHADQLRAPYEEKYPPTSASGGSAMANQEFLPHLTPEQRDHAQRTQMTFWEQHIAFGAPRDTKPRCTKGKQKGPAIVLWVILGTGLLVIVGIALGVGLGVGLKSRQGSSSPPATMTASTSTASSAHSTSTSTSSSSTPSASGPATSGTTGIAANSCNFTSPQTYKGPGNTSFIEHCFTDWPETENTPDGGVVHDLAEVVVYTFEACMDACVSYNSNLTGGSIKCAAVTYNANLTLALARHAGNCYLKDAKGVDLPADVNAASASISS